MLATPQARPGLGAQTPPTQSRTPLRPQGLLSAPLQPRPDAPSQQQQQHGRQQQQRRRQRWRRAPLAAARHTPPVDTWQQQPQQHQEQQPSQQLQASRRQLLAASVVLPGVLGGLAPPPAACASGLLQLPATAEDLHNTYFLVRAGESEAEAAGFVLTNPVWKTSTTAGLSKTGRQQVVRQTYPALRALGLDSAAWLWPSITQNAYQTAELIAALHGLGRNRVVGEYSFLDARGVGELERLPLGEAAAALAAGDALAPTWRPAPNQDGTVHESSADVLVRGRQLLSLLETQYVGENIVVISPDSDNLSVLQAGVLGVDLRSHHQYAFAPGEARRLRVSEELRPEPPSSLACPRPPQCV